MSKSRRILQLVRLCFCRDKEMKLFFKGWVSHVGFFTVWSWIGVWDCCTKIWNSQSVQACFFSWSKCWLYIYCLGSFLACPVSLPTGKPCIKMKPENKEMKLLFIWLVCYVTFLLPCELHLLHKPLVCWLQNICQKPISSESNIRRLIKHWR